MRDSSYLYCQPGFSAKYGKGSHNIVLGEWLSALRGRKTISGFVAGKIPKPRGTHLRGLVY